MITGAPIISYFSTSHWYFRKVAKLVPLPVTVALVEAVDGQDTAGMIEEYNKLVVYIL